MAASFRFFAEIQEKNLSFWVAYSIQTERKHNFNDSPRRFLTAMDGENHSHFICKSQKQSDLNGGARFSPKYFPPSSTPIVLHHGLLGFVEVGAGPLKMSYFGGIEDAIAGRGHPVIRSRVHPTAGIKTRAGQLKEAVLREMEAIGGTRVVIIAHSMGGLDARYMISKLQMADCVAALVTISAPHRGSAYADWFVKHLGERLGGFRLMESLKLDVQGARDLTIESCRRFNDEISDSPRVRYYSISARRPWHLVPAFALHSHKIICDAEGDNDGLVSVASSKWGKHLGVWPADHFHTVNKRLVIEIKNPTGDISPYYLRLLDAIRDDGVEMNSRLPLQ